MIRIGEYLNDGANWQAQAVLAYIRGNIAQFREGTWNPIANDYEVEVFVSRYENGREQGYMVSAIYRWNKQKTFAFYEHQNVDRLNVRHYDGTLMIEASSSSSIYDKYESKSDYDKDFACGEIKQCGDYIIGELKKFVDECIDADTDYRDEMKAKANALKEFKRQYGI